MILYFYEMDHLYNLSKDLVEYKRIFLTIFH